MVPSHRRGGHDLYRYGPRLEPPQQQRLQRHHQQQRPGKAGHALGIFFVLLDGGRGGGEREMSGRTSSAPGGTGGNLGEHQQRQRRHEQQDQRSAAPGSGSGSQRWRQQQERRQRRQRQQRLPRLRRPPAACAPRQVSPVGRGTGAGGVGGGQQTGNDTVEVKRQLGAASLRPAAAAAAPATST